ncbi:MAG: hypothetical protein JKY25_08975 [Robiginitomaculum sp.]|nr:hypothetical protein [Robiginitomaculum sp.]
MFKFIFAMLITAGLAGGAVYYGTNMTEFRNNEISLPLKWGQKTQSNTFKISPQPKVALNSKIDLVRVMPTLMEQADKISTIEIRDQAYLDIVSASVSDKRFSFADAAMQNIIQPELRDTARSRMAIALAMDGRADDAFELIDAVEVDALRDVMRLQVLEALIAPQNLPPGLLPQ